MENVLKAFVCVVEDYEGNQKSCRVFANSDVDARKKLIKKFPDCYIHPAISFKDFAKGKES